MTKKRTTRTLQAMKQAQEKIASLTAYDATLARVLDEQGVDVILVGDSLGMVIQGATSTLGVSLQDMIYHSRIVSGSVSSAQIVVDMPFMSYQTGAQALGNAARLVSEGGAEVVKLEGGAEIAQTVSLLTERGLTVCGHLGLTPQSIHQLGGYVVQGKELNAAEKLLHDATVLEQAGASMLVLECVPTSLAARITTELTIPTIGIGAGNHCDGQVLVLHDMLGLSAMALKFSRNFLADSDSVQAAVASYVKAVKDGSFPATKHEMAE